MAANDESIYEECEQELYETALEEYFTELTLHGDEFDELSRITNDALSPRSNIAEEPNTHEVYHLALQECAKDYLQSSTPKRQHKFSKPQRQPNLLVRFKAHSAESEQSPKNSGNQAIAISPPLAKPPELPSLSLIIREQRRQLILSPFSLNLKNAISRQESALKRKQRIETSKKAQRASLRV